MFGFCNLFVALCLCLLADHAAADDSARRTVDPRRQAHAHNDYEHQRPLLDALDQGFGSVEADIFLRDGELLVAHTPFQLSPERTLKRLYLEPLRQRISANGGSVHGDGHPFGLLIDIKSDGQATYRVLHEQLSQYHEMLTAVTDGIVHPGPVTAVISGNRPVEAVVADSPRYVGIDGRLSDLESDQPAHVMPLISDHWGRHFRWRGEGDMPIADRQKLDAVVHQAHQAGRRVRFWAIPDKPPVWAALQRAGVDLINTDNLAGLGSFLQSTSSE